MEQLPLVIGPWESRADALRDDVKALGGAKEVGAWFIPEKSVEAQRNYVNDRISENRRERFQEDQVELIMRRAIDKRGYSAALWHECDVLGVERPKAKDPESERDRAMRSFVAATKSLERSIEEVKRLGVAIPLRSIG
jgi:hypothetical protein